MFRRKKQNSKNIFTPACQYPPVVVAQLGEWTENSVLWIIYLNEERGTITLQGPVASVNEIIHYIFDKKMPYCVFRISDQESQDMHDVMDQIENFLRGN